MPVPLVNSIPVVPSAGIFNDGSLPGFSLASLESEDCSMETPAASNSSWVIRSQISCGC